MFSVSMQVFRRQKNILTIHRLLKQGLQWSLAAKDCYFPQTNAFHNKKELILLTIRALTVLLGQQRSFKQKSGFACY